MAKENPIKGVIFYVRKRNIKRIIEFGIGIGTMPFALIEARRRGEIGYHFTYSGIEDNSFCIDAFKKNVPGHGNFIRHFHSFSEVVSSGEMYDLVIVDGKDKSFEKVLGVLSKGGMILVEGGRRPQLEQIRNQAEGRKYLQSGFTAFNTYKSGRYTVFFFEPPFVDYVCHIINKVSTFIVYRIIQLFKKYI